MNLSRTLVLSSGCALMAIQASAQVVVSNAWIRGTVSGQTATGAFMQLASPADATLVGAKSPAAKSVEIHEMKTEGGMMKMRAMPALALPAGKTVALEPGGYHMMLFDLTRPLKPGETVLLTLTINDKNGKQETVEVTAIVRPLTASAPTPATK